MPVKRGTDNRGSTVIVLQISLDSLILFPGSLAFSFVVEGLPVQEVSVTSPVWRNFFIKRPTALL